MAAPTAPTLETITTEGLKKAGYASPTSAKLTRAQDYFMEEIKTDIWTHAKKLKFLYTEGCVIINEGQSRYSMPTDFSSFVGNTAILMYGSDTGTLQAASASSLTLAATEDHTEDYMQGKEIVVTSGTGEGQYGQCTAWNNTTKVATTNPEFGTTPDGDEEYTIVDVHYPLKIDVPWNMFSKSYPMNKERPITLHPIGDENYGEFVLFPAPDQAYIVKLNYYINLLTLDLASTLMATLYQRWRSLWVMGVMVKQWEDDDDERAEAAQTVYRAMVQVLGTREQLGQDLSTLQATVS